MTAQILDYESSSVNSIRVQVVDELNGSMEGIFYVSVTDLTVDHNQTGSNAGFVLSNNTVSENRSVGTEVGRFKIFGDTGEDITTGYQFEVLVGEGSGTESPTDVVENKEEFSPVHGVSSLTYDRGNWYTLRDISLKMEDVSGGTQAYLWPGAALGSDTTPYKVLIGGEVLPKQNLQKKSIR